MYKLNPEWPSDYVSINSVSVNRDTILKDPMYEEYTKPKFTGKPPLLVRVDKEEPKKEPEKLEVKEPEEVVVIANDDVEASNNSGIVLNDEVVKTVEKEYDDLRLLEGVGPIIAKKLNRATYTSYKKIAETTPVQLATDIGRSVELAEKIINSAKQFVQE